MDKLTTTEAFWLGLLAMVGGPLIVWFPFSDFDMAHRLMRGSDTVVLLKLLGFIIVGWGYIGWEIGAVIGTFLTIDDFERYTFAMVCILIWFVLTLIIIAALTATYYVHSIFHISLSVLLISWLLFGILAMLAIVACRSIR